jgi:glyoxylase-like metal-dependent hydrolase (beta-lactamase superfamily II)
VAKNVVAHAKADEHMRNPPGGEPPADQLFPHTRFTETWASDLGDERVSARHYGRAHTSGDIVVTFERANVAHMRDLMFNQRHPVVDRAAGATIRNWASVLDRTVRDHANDTIYIFGHANSGLPVTGDHADLARFRDYLNGVIAFVETQVKAGRTREEVLAMRGPLPGFESFGPFGQPGPRDPLTCAYEEVTTS